jgi:hypothetical protein
MTDPASQTPARHPVTFKRLAVPIDGTDRVTVRRGLAHPGRSDIRLDLYDPPDHRPGEAGFVVLVNGLSDAGARRVLGCGISEMASYDSWARAIAASGLVAITYTTGDDPACDLGDVIAHLKTHRRDLGLDPDRGALWACSSHVPNALGLLLAMPDVVRSAVLCYGFMLDLDGSQAVADAQRTWRFVNPAHGRAIGELPHTPLLVVRAGADAFAGVNTSIDAFTRHALALNLPITLINHDTGAHAFDLDEDSPTTRLIVLQILSFLTTHLAR